MRFAFDKSTTQVVTQTGQDRAERGGPGQGTVTLLD